MTELEITRTLMFVGFVLWAVCGYAYGRMTKRRDYLKAILDIPNHIDELNKEIKELEHEKEELIKVNKSLWYWSYAPHSEATFVTIKQQDKDGEEVAHSSIHLTDKEHWVEPVCYADDRGEDFHEWKNSLQHNQS